MKGNSEELHSRVKEFMEHQEGAPPEKGQQGGGGVANIHSLVMALKAMVAQLMCDSVTSKMLIGTSSCF